jgi:hypothetical protein
MGGLPGLHGLRPPIDPGTLIENMDGKTWIF